MTDPDLAPVVYDHHNIRFTCSTMGNDPNRWIVNAVRISDGRHLHDNGLYQFRVDHRPTPDEMAEIVEGMLLLAAGNYEPDPTLCYGCQRPFEADRDTDYQFDNALWIRLDGGYGMFIDPVPDGGPRDPGAPFYKGNKHYEYGCVICHDCAHDLCEKIPWMDRMIRPLRSHSHHYKQIPDLLAKGHQGWDLDKHYKEQTP